MGTQGEIIREMIGHVAYIIYSGKRACHLGRRPECEHPTPFIIIFPFFFLFKAYRCVHLYRYLSRTSTLRDPARAPCACIGQGYLWAMAPRVANDDKKIAIKLMI